MRSGPPTLDRLRNLAEEYAKVAGGRPDAAFERVGLLLHQDLSRANYESTPANAATFAGTGGDGVHFSIVQRDGVAGEDAPIVMTVPMNFGQENLIVGANLRDFLGVGSSLGFFFLEQLTYDRPACLAAYAGGVDRYRLDDDARTLLARIKLAFGVRPPADLEAHLRSLEHEFASWLVPGEPDEAPGPPPTQAEFLAHVAKMRREPPRRP
jgi:hypothetical protein